MNKNGSLIPTDEEKGEVLNNFFASVFTGNLSPCPSPVDGLQDRDQRGKAPPTVREDQVRDHLRNLNVHKSVGLDEMYPRVLRELADFIAKPLPMIFERSWQSGEVPGDWRKGNILPIFCERGIIFYVGLSGGHGLQQCPGFVPCTCSRHCRAFKAWI